MRVIRTAIGWAALGALAVGCSSESKPATSPTVAASSKPAPASSKPASASSKPAAGGDQACQLVAADKVAEIVGVAVERVEETGPVCTFHTASGEVMLGATRFVAGVDTAELAAKPVIPGSKPAVPLDVNGSAGLHSVGERQGVAQHLAAMEFNGWVLRASATGPAPALADAKMVALLALLTAGR